MASKKRSASMVEDSDDAESKVSPVAKKTKSASEASPPSGKDGEGNPYWELSSKRRVGVSQFRKTCFVNIREFYEKDGNTLPGKKGISLSVEQYAALLKSVPAINAALRELGHQVDDVDSTNTPALTAGDAKKERKKPVKSNIDVTSDEEEDD